MHVLALILFLAPIVCIRAGSFDEDHDYCFSPCDKDKKHIMCENKGCEVDKEKYKSFEIVELTDVEKRFILDEHNKYRDQVAKGKELRGMPGPQPPAANMMALSYSDELGRIAQCWANTGNTTASSMCNALEFYPYDGQNLGTWYSEDKDFFKKTGTIQAIKRIMYSWYEEVRLFNNNYTEPYKFNPEYGHYTLMVWANFELVGCAIVKFANDEWNTILMVCNYASDTIAGNVEDGQMYKVGMPCDECPSGKSMSGCGFEFSSLCGTGILDVSRFISPITMEQVAEDSSTE